MLDDGSQGWYIAIRLAPQELAAGDSMRLFATHLRGWINLDIALPKGVKAMEMDMRLLVHPGISLPKIRIAHNLALN